jgi:hypothetical protein
VSLPIENRRQTTIDFEYDDRVVKLAAEFGLMMSPHLLSGTKMEVVNALTARMALLATKRLGKFVEPPETMLCHTCDAQVGPTERARVVVCIPCGLHGGSPGSDG